MRKLIKLMLKEEWRMQTAWVHPVLFASFPFLIAILFYLTAFAITKTNAITIPYLVILAHVGLLLVGFGSGLINFIRKAVIQRQITEINFFYTCTTLLPITQPKIILAFIIREFTYLLFYLILPACLGISLALGNLSLAAAAIISLSLSFLLGACTGFAFFGLYEKIGAISILLILLSYALTGLWISPTTIFTSLISGTLDLASIASVLGASIIFLFLAFAFTDLYIDFKGKPVTEGYSRLRSFFSPLLSKDMLGIYRTGYYLFVLSYVFILGSLIWFIIRGILPFPFLGITLGVLGLASWFVVHLIDEVDIYRHFPIDLKSFFSSKVTLFFGLYLPAMYILLYGVSLWENTTFALIPSMLLGTSTCFYTIGIITAVIGITASKLLNPITYLLTIILLVPAFGGGVAALVLDNTMATFMISSVLSIIGLASIAYATNKGVYEG